MNRPVGAEPTAGRRWWRGRGPVLVVLVLVAVFAAAGILAGLGGSGPGTQEDQLRSVASTLRCPVCAGEDVADSAAPLAESMRLVITEQLEQGRSPGQIRAWFAQTYGDDVLLAPPARGAGWVMWAVPLVILASAAVLLVRRRSSRRTTLAVGGLATAAVLAGWLVPAALEGARPADRPGAAVDEGAGEQLAAAAPVGVLRAGVAEMPGSAPLRATLASRLEEDGAYGEAAAEYGALVRLRPLDADLRYRQGFAQARAGDHEAARATLAEALEVDEEHPETLLLLGSLVQSDDPAQGAALLERFLEAAPDHAQAEEVAAWLEDRDGTLPVVDEDTGATDPGAGAADPSSDVAGASTLRLGLTEWSVQASVSELTPGTVEVVVTNAGGTAHDVVISGEAGTWATPVLAPGERHEMTIEAVPGEELSLVCTLAGHHAAGMHSTLQVAQGTP